MTEFEKPNIQILHDEPGFGQFVISPLEKGYGTTLGNALRRVLLSSIPGAAVTALQIDGVLHEFSTIPGVRQDVTELVLNFKGLILRSRSQEPKILYLQAKGEGLVQASDIEGDAEVDVLNPDCHLATLDGDDSELHIQIYVEQGKGYVSGEGNKKGTYPIGVIPIDSFFSPVRKVSYKVEPTRVGQAIEHDRLDMSIWTNQAMSPVDALVQAAQILEDSFAVIRDIRSAYKPRDEDGDLALTPIEKLHLSVRSFNALSSAGIVTVGELVAKTSNDLLSIKNFGKRSQEEVVQKLEELDLRLKEEE